MFCSVIWANHELNSLDSFVLLLVLICVISFKIILNLGHIWILTTNCLPVVKKTPPTIPSAEKKTPNSTQPVNYCGSKIMACTLLLH
jgi:hypothetical protein